MSYYEPQPKQRPKRPSRRQPKALASSGIGEKGLVANWLMYYAKGGTHLHDFSGNGNHGTLKNGTKWVDESSASWALWFDGEDDMVEISKEAPFDFTSNFTVLVWVYREGQGGNNPRVVQKDSGSAWGMLEDGGYIDGDNSMSWRWTSGGTTTKIDEPDPIPNYEWTMYTGMHTGSAMVLYRNVTQVAEQTGVDSIDTNDVLPRLISWRGHLVW